MSRISVPRVLKTIPAITILLALPALCVGIGLAAQDRQTLQVPNGLAFSEFEGYDTWQDVAVSETEGSVKAILANPAMINAYREGVPSNGKLFPEGSKVVKIEWVKKRNAVSPYFVEVPDVLKSLSFIVKDSKGSRTRTDGLLPSLIMMPRPTRSGLP